MWYNYASIPDLHRSIKMQEIRVCSTCKQTFPLNSEHFHRDGNSKLGQAYACKECRRQKIKTQYTNDPVVRERMRKRSLDSARRQRYETLSHYCGGEPYCQCCGEKELVFLTLDHVNDDGCEHRRTIGNNGRSIHIWAKKNDYPNSLQVLCHNCNWARHVLGCCPHQMSSSKDIRLNVVLAGVGDIVV